MKLEDRVLQYLPLLAPVPTAWMVGQATIDVLRFPFPVAVVSALVIEGLGFVAVNTAIQMRDFNYRLTVNEKAQKLSAPVGQAYAATVLYTVVALLMTVLTHIFPQLAVYAPMPFILMGVAGAWLYALRADLSIKIQERNQGREQARQERVERQQAKAKLQAQAAKQANKLQPQVVQARKQADKQVVQDEALLAYWRDNPQASDQQVADTFGKSRQAIQQRRDKLLRQGAIKTTDKGVEIVGIPVGTQVENKQ